MKTLSSGAQAALEADAMEVKARVVVEFGNNRFNDDLGVASSSTKLSYLRIDGKSTDGFYYWKQEDVFNNKNRNSMRWGVCDGGIKADGSYRCISKQESEYERGWWSGNKSDGSGNFGSPEWVYATFQPRNINVIDVYLNDAHDNMKSITVQYKSDGVTWVNALTNYVLGTTEYYKRIELGATVSAQGLRIYVNSTQVAADFARVSELQGIYVADISEDIISCSVDQTREEYEGTVPIGTVGANSFQMELDNIDQKYSPNNTSSPYYPYLGPDNKVNIEYGIKVSGVYEYVQMGVFYVDDHWSAKAGTVTTSVGGRDYSKFLQDSQIKIGKVWINKYLYETLPDLLAREGLSEDQLNIAQLALHRFSALYVKDTSVWEFLKEAALADQGQFGFRPSGNFFYQSYSAPETPPTAVYTLSDTTNIIDGQIDTIIYSNKIIVKVSPTEIRQELSKIWGAESPSILAWTDLQNGIQPAATTINSNADLDVRAFPKSGYLYIGDELISYDTRSNTQFLECKRGFLDTVPAIHYPGDLIGEAHYWEIEYNNSPALHVQEPYITAIDLLPNEPGEGTPQAKVVHYSRDAFTAKLAIGNIVKYNTILEGQGRSKKIDDPNLPWATLIAGIVLVTKTNNELVNKEDPSGLNANLIRRYGKNEIEINNTWVQSREHGQKLANNFITEFSKPRKIISLENVSNLALEINDQIMVSNFDQLSISNEQYHIIGIRYTYDGGLSSSLTLREVSSTFAL